jgi:hypothetical protein
MTRQIFAPKVAPVQVVALVGTSIELKAYQEGSSPPAVACHAVRTRSYHCESTSRSSAFAT